jgi:tetratricopeptide (TPR) repeat protein
MDEAGKLVLHKEWERAKTPLQTLIDLYPNQSGDGNVYAMLAAVQHGLGETNLERGTLEKWAAQDNDAVDAYLRLMQLGENAGDWKTVAQNADRFLAVNPLVPQPYRSRARARETLGETNQAANAYQKLLLLDPADPAEVHFQLARLLRLNDGPAARRHVLQALEEAPRFREAHRLLFELAQAAPNPTNSDAAAEPKK